MKNLGLVVFTIFISTGLQANEALQDDPIMKESLTRQGIPGPAYSSNGERASMEKRQAQTESKSENEAAIEKSDIQKMEARIQGLQRKVNLLERRLNNTESRENEQRQKQTSQVKTQEKEKQMDAEDKKLSNLTLGQELQEQKAQGTIGKFNVVQGTAAAIANYQNAPAETRNLPALKVCATMADANRLSAADLIFMGIDPESARRITQKRREMGEFKSFKQMKSIEGITEEAVGKLEDDIIAIQSERYSE